MKTMKTMKTMIVVSLICFLVFTACKKTPSGVSLSVDKTEIYVGQTVTFNLTANDAITYDWDFGDGSSKGDYGTFDVQHTYNSPGSYTIKVTAFSKNEKKKTESNSITVNVKKFNTNLIGTYNVKDTSWNYVNYSVTPYNYQVTIEDGGDSKGEYVYVKGYMNVFTSEKVRCNIYLNSSGTYTLTHLNDYPFANTNQYYRIVTNNINLSNPATFVTQGDTHDKTVIYTSGTTNPYFFGNSYWTKQ